MWIAANTSQCLTPEFSVTAQDGSTATLTVGPGETTSVDVPSELSGISVHHVRGQFGFVSEPFATAGGFVVC
jgi:hypothetical protein